MEIKRRSRHDVVIYTGFYDAEGTYPELRQMDVQTLKPVSVKRQYGAVIRAGLTISTTKIDRSDFDALIVSCDGLGSFINFANPELPSLCLCFTPLRAVYDPEYRVRHLSPNPLKRLAQSIVARVYRHIDKKAWRYYRKVFCISNEVRQRVLTGDLCDPSIIDIAYPGIDGELRKISAQCEPFFFLPGRIMWTKNIQLAIMAFQQFKQEVNVDFSLKIAGMIDGKSQGYYQQLCELVGDDSSIEFIRDPTDSEMRNYYRRCHAVLFTAFNEDLGITPMEAGVFGKPVIAVDRGGPREIVVNDKTGLLVEPEPGAFSSAMQRLVNDPELARRMGQANFERSGLYTWDKFVIAIDDYLDELATERQ
jgi:glycosyltransferase involved in cell wall biosynthesis